MNNKVTIIKVRNYPSDSDEIKNSCQAIITNVNTSFSKKEMKFYIPQPAFIDNLYFLTGKEQYKITKDNTRENIQETLNKMPFHHCIYKISGNKSNLFFVICYHGENKKTLYVRENPILLLKGTRHIELHYQIFLKYTSSANKSVIDNFIKLQNLEDGDFNAHMICCENPDLARQFRYLIEQAKKTHKTDYSIQTTRYNDEDSYDEPEHDEPEHDEPEHDEPEHDEPEKTGFDCQTSIDTDNKEFENPFKQQDIFCERTSNISHNKNRLKRTNFQRDYERIIHTKAFRRLVDKAQIFTSSKGDHYRTRMTHTMEVVQIARGIAKELDLNIELTEAIALAHDIGHTPFGHQGERTLNDILQGKLDGIANRNTDEDDFYGGFKHNLQALKVTTMLEEKYFEHDGINLSYQVLEGILKHTGFLACKRCMDNKDCRSKNKDGQCKKIENEVKDFLSENFNKDKLFLTYRFPTNLEGQVVAIADEIAQRSHDIDDALRSNLISFKEIKEYLFVKKYYPLRNILEQLEKQFCDLEDEKLLTSGKDLLHGRVVSEIIAYFIDKVCEQSEKNIREYAEKNSGFFNEYHRVDEELIDFDETTGHLCKYLEGIITKKVITCNEVSCFDNKAKMIVQALFRAYFEKPLLLPQGVLLKIFEETMKNHDNAVNLTIADCEIVTDEIAKITNPNGKNTEEKDRNEYYLKQKILVRAIVDYIAGMTDSYAINEYNRIYKA